MPSTGKPLVLGYHCLGAIAREHDPIHLAVTPERFRAQVNALLGRGYEFVTLSEFARRLRATGPPAGVCALTFDDGTADNATLLPQLLEKLGVPATLFVCPGLLGRPYPWLTRQAGVRFMSEEDLRQVARLSFIEIGSHTFEHRDLSAATADEAYRELAGSKRALEDLTGRPVETFAYPYGRYSPACPAAAERAGYLCAVTADTKGGWEPYELRRAGIAAWDRRITFALKSRGVFHAVLRSPPGRLALGARRSLGRTDRRL
jgi:peptidoglycan/xylan/chitin deacetylase (PgdA/CDA1 family)